MARSAESDRGEATVRRGLPLLIGLVWLFARPSSAAALAPPNTGEVIDRLLADAALRGGIQAIIVRSLRDGSVWYSRNPDVLLLPASNQKLITSAAALQLLGPQWRHETAIWRSGRLGRDGTLNGALYLRGGGDPLLDDSALADMAEQAYRHGIRALKGRVVGDGSVFDQQRYGYGWSWDDMSYYYSAPVDGLNLNGNVRSVTVRPGRAVGRRAVVDVSPTRSGCELRVQAVTGPAASANTISVERALGGRTIIVSGSVPVGVKASEVRPVPVTVDEPALYAALQFTEHLRRRGISVARAACVGQTPRTGAAKVASHRGAPLSVVLAKLNKPSDNLVAECLLKTLGALGGAGGTTKAGCDRVVGWLTSIGAEASGIDMTDGSGLSRQNFVTARTLMTVLTSMAAHTQGAVFIDSLPIAGVDGTLRNRMKGTAAEANCRAKTGYVSSVSSLSGYVTTADSERLAFVMLMNNHKARNAAVTLIQNRIVEWLAGVRAGTGTSGASRP